MHILVTNDDGILAEGIRALTEAARAAGHRVTVCAPDRERSASSHSINIKEPLQMKETTLSGARAFSVNGTPVDCARLGMYLLRDDRPDICVSGINRGPNLGGACIYSGTVGAAMEASMAGCPAVASSLRSFTQKDYTAAARITLSFAEWALRHPLPRGVIYNVNVPDLPFNEIKGYRRTQVLAPVFLTDARYTEHVSEYNNRYFFLADGPESMPYPEDSDDVLSANGWVTVSALSWDITHKGGMDDIDIPIDFPKRL